MASANVAPTFSPDSFFTSPETLDSDAQRQARIVAELGTIVTSSELTPDQQETAVAALRETSGCGNLEFRMLHMFALHSLRVAAEAS